MIIVSALTLHAQKSLWNIWESFSKQISRDGQEIIPLIRVSCSYAMCNRSYFSTSIVCRIYLNIEETFRSHKFREHGQKRRWLCIVCRVCWGGLEWAGGDNDNMDGDDTGHTGNHWPPLATTGHCGDNGSGGVVRGILMPGHRSTMRH